VSPCTSEKLDKMGKATDMEGNAVVNGTDKYFGF